MELADIVARGWEALGARDFDALVADYVEDMTLVMPGQDDVLSGRAAFRTALDGLGALLPPGFEITRVRNVQGEGEVVSIVEWRSTNVAASQLAILFRFRGDRIREERWFVDTEQWKRAF